MKKLFSIVLTLCLMLGMSTISVSAEVEYKSMIDDETIRQKVLSSEYADGTTTKYITLDEYFEKYSRNNIITGLNKAEIKNNAQINGSTVDNAVIAQSLELENTEPNDVFMSMVDGEFLGMKILKISDLPPDDTRLSFTVKYTKSKDTASVNAIVPYNNYTLYYDSNKFTISEGDALASYEPNAGSYMYKYSNYNAYEYLCETDFVFNNTTLYSSSTDKNNMYTYIAAISPQQTLDFGLMSNPSASNRNKGMYAFYNRGALEDKTLYPDSEQWVVESWPKVGIQNASQTNPMTLENKTVQLRLGIGNQTAELYMESGGTCIYYKQLDSSVVPYLVSGTSSPLTFMTAVTCVRESGQTRLNSGSYFRNVKMKDTFLYDYNSSSRKPFVTLGNYTRYTFICQPSKVSFAYGNDTNNWETISINYN